MHIKLNFQLFILALLFFFTSKIEVYSITLICIVIHECAHIIVAMCLGFKIKIIKVRLLGFNILLEKNISLTKKFDKLLVAFAGPFANILVAIMFLFIPVGSLLQGKIVYTNILLAAINLIPIYPLDGGRILKEVLSFRLDKLQVIILVEKVTYISIVIITILSSVFILYYKNIAIFIGVIFLWYLALQEYAKNKYRKIAYSILKDGY